MDLNNKTVVLTGATSGIGLATAHAVCEAGGHLIGVGRSVEKCEKVRAELVKKYPQACIDFLSADFSSLRNVRILAEDIHALATSYGKKQLDVLINNAGTFTSWYMASAEGFEMQFAVNHLAPFLLVHLLISLLRNAPHARIITLSSGSHYHTRIHWKDIFLRKHYNCLLAYKQSKLANVFFTRELQRRLGDNSGIRAFAADPGLVNTEMGLKNTVGLPKLVWSIRKRGGENPSVAAKSILYLACEESLQHSDEIYYRDCKAKRASRRSYSAEDSGRLWELSERMCGIHSNHFGL